MTTTGSNAAAVPSQPLLPRARTLFVRFLVLATGVQLIELLDAGTPWWPDRFAAFVGVGVVLGWGLHLYRTRRATWLGDVVAAATVTIIGLGLGRSGAILVSLVSVLALRSLYGQRRDAAFAALGLFAGLAVVTAAHHGPEQLVVDAGFVIVVAAASALMATLRGLGELLGQHDLHARLDEVATTTAARLVAVTSTVEVDRLEQDARRQVATIGGDPSLRDPEAAVLGVLRRVAADVRLARQRIGSEARYRVIAEGNRDGVYLRDTPVPGPDGRYSYLNPAAEGILGLRAADLVADPSLVAQHMHEDDLAQVTAAIDEDGLIAVPAEVRWRRPDGVWRWLRLQERVVEVAGEQRQILGMLRDVTSQHEEAAALRRVVERERAATAELRHLDAMKSTFLQAVSHELRTPLSAVIGAAQTLEARDELLDASQRRRMLEIVQRQSARLERLLTDLLDVDRLSRGLVSPDRRPTDLVALGAGVVAALDPAAATRIVVNGDPTTVPVDAAKVERIVDNLLNNALRHTPAGCDILYRVDVHADGARLVVEDEGPGIPDGLKTELFEPFSQGPGAQQAASPGTGIGLALVRALAELHGGRVDVEDRHGGGARFVVWLPAQDLPVGPPPGPADEPVGDTVGPPTTPSSGAGRVLEVSGPGPPGPGGGPAEAASA